MEAVRTYENDGDAFVSYSFGGRYLPGDTGRKIASIDPERVCRKMGNKDPGVDWNREFSFSGCAGTRNVPDGTVRGDIASLSSAITFTTRARQLCTILTESVDPVGPVQLAEAAAGLHLGTAVREEVGVSERHGKAEHAAVRVYHVHELGVGRRQMTHLARPRVQRKRRVESCSAAATKQ